MSGIEISSHGWINYADWADGTLYFQLEAGPGWGGDWISVTEPLNITFHKEIDWSRYSTLYYDIEVVGTLEAPGGWWGNVYNDLTPGAGAVKGYFRGCFGGTVIDIKADSDYRENNHKPSHYYPIYDSVSKRERRYVHIPSNDIGTASAQLWLDTGYDQGVASAYIHSLKLLR